MAIDRYNPGEPRDVYLNYLAERLESLDDRLETLEGISAGKARARETVIPSFPPVSVPKLSHETHLAATGAWRPIGDGQRFWADPQGFSRPRGEAPQDVLDQWQKAGHET